MDFKNSFSEARETNHLFVEDYKVLTAPPPKKHGCSELSGRQCKTSSLLSSLKCVLICLALVFFALTGNAQAQQTCPYTLPSTPTDKDILILFYCATDGEHWATKTNWLTNSSIDTWYEVSLDINGRVSSLGLDGNGLSGEIPAELGSLSKLQVLRLSRNQLSGEIPAELGSLTELNFMYLDNNQLSGEIPAELGRLTTLPTLFLDNNQLSGEIPAELENMSSLKSLFLANNQLSGEIPAELGNMSSLQSLDLSNNQLSEEIPAELGMTKLLTLNLSDNQLSGEIPAELGMTKLSSLRLINNQLSGEIPAELGSLSELHTLTLTNNQLSGEIPAELGMTKLSNLRLDNNQLSGEIPAELGMTALSWLYLHNNQLSGEIPAELGSLTNLSDLRLHNNQLSEEIPAELGNMSSLSILLLANNELSGAIPAELGNMTSLQYLYLDRNELSGPIPPQLIDLTNLIVLRLYSNQLSGAIPDLRDLTSLTDLYLNNNMLTGTIPTWLNSLTNLEYLYLNNNMLTGSTPATELGALAGLEELGLWDNEGLTWDTISDELGKKADRAVLRALYNANGGEEWANNEKWLSGEDPMEWYGVSTDMNTGRVSGLNLGNNGLKEELTNALEALDGLTDLNISNNRQLIGELPLRLMNLPLVETLDIRCTGVSAPADMDFQMWLSGITFRQVCPPPPPPPPPPAPPAQPLEQVMGVEVMAGVEQLLVSWYPVSEADGYKVQWKSGSQQFDSSPQHIVTSGATTSYTISNLVSGTEYTVRVIATKSGAADATPSSEVVGTPSVADTTPPTTGQGGGGCSIASNEVKGNTSNSVLLNLLLMGSALFLVASRKGR